MTNCEELANENSRGQNNLEATQDRAWEGCYWATHRRFEELACTVD